MFARQKVEFRPPVKDSAEPFRKGFRRILPLSTRVFRGMAEARAATVFMLLLLVYFLMMTGFASLYWGFELLRETRGNEPVTSFASCWYFSAVCQTTIGLGDVCPTDGGQLLVATQAILGTLVFALSTGLVVAKLVIPDVPLELAGKIVFDPRDGAFRIRVRVLATAPMPKWHTTMTVRALDRSGRSRVAATNLAVIRLSYDQHNAEPGKSYLCPTLPLSCVVSNAGTIPWYARRLCSIEKDVLAKGWKELTREVTAQAPTLLPSMSSTGEVSPVVLTPANISCFTHLSAVIEYHLKGSVGSGMLCRSYDLQEDVECGRFDPVVKRDSADRSLIVYVDHGLFNDITRTTPAQCKACPFVAGCVIVRRRAERKDGEEYKKVVEEVDA